MVHLKETLISCKYVIHAFFAITAILNAIQFEWHFL